jgi:8-oxo-dGTP pyrophosphatase MutT (NUDIX family)
VTVRLDVHAVREALAASLPLPALGSIIDVREARAAAVIVALRFEPALSALLVLRASHLADHAGEVGFPGGKPDPGDADLTATALRELDEEVAVPPSAVTILGPLSPMPVITGRYLIHPFVGALAEGAAPRVASPEIERVLELPLLPLLTGEVRMSAVQGLWSDAMRFAPHFEVGGAVLYGASAYILYELLLRLAGRLGLSLPEPIITDVLPWGDRYAPR